MTKGRFNDLAGKRYGRLLVVKRAENRNRRVYWHCQCDCGAEVEVRSNSLTCGPTVSCGCYHRDVVTKHGMWQTPIYNIWNGMIDRCRNQNHRAYNLYGGRGVRVCERWQDFSLFYKDMGRRPEGHSLDRIDNDGDYEPGNCRWSTYKQQSRNRNDNRMLAFKGKTKCLKEWSEVVGIKYSTLSERLRRGWSIENTLTTPVNLGNRWLRERAVPGV